MTGVSLDRGMQGASRDRLREQDNSGIEFLDDAVELHGREILVES